jgi:hypothetical protein
MKQRQVAVGIGSLVGIAILVGLLWCAMPGGMGPLYLDGRIVDGQGRPVGQATVSIRSSLISPGVRSPKTATTDTVGRYSIVLIDAPPKGELIFSIITRDGRSAERRIPRPAGGNNQLRTDIELSTR